MPIDRASLTKHCSDLASGVIPEAVWKSYKFVPDDKKNVRYPMDGSWFLTTFIEFSKKLPPGDSANNPDTKALSYLFHVTLKILVFVRAVIQAYPDAQLECYRQPLRWTTRLAQQHPGEFVVDCGSNPTTIYYGNGTTVRSVRLRDGESGRKLSSTLPTSLRDDGAKRPFTDRWHIELDDRHQSSNARFPRRCARRVP